MNFPRRAFTLVEILVALAVVGILAAILFPVLGRARARAHTSTCTSNLRQINKALSLYTSDYDGFYPPCVTIKPSDNGIKAASVWWMNIGLQSLPVCPEVNPDWMVDKLKLRRLVGSYASNFRLTTNSGSRTKPKLFGRAEFVLRYPTLTVVAFDARPLCIGMKQPDTMRTISELKEVLHPGGLENRILQLPLGATRHQGGANYLFGDGHVKWFKPEQLSTARQSDGVKPGFGL